MSARSAADLYQHYRVRMGFDVNRLRRYYNRLDRWLDRSSLLEERRERIDLGASAEPATARQAFGFVRPVVLRMDRSASLKLITGSENLDASGQASRWEFFFDLPKRRAKAAVEWVLPWDERADSYGSPHVEAVFRPFQAPENVLYGMIDEGRLLYRQLNGHWRDEMQKTPALPQRFRDSDAVMREFAERGLDASRDEVTLAARGVSDSEVVWTAQTRHSTYRTSFQ